MRYQGYSLSVWTLFAAGCVLMAYAFVRAFERGRTW